MIPATCLCRDADHAVAVLKGQRRAFASSHSDRDGCPRRPVVGAELGDGAYWLVLFVVLAAGAELIREIKTAIRARASPRYVPDDIIAVTALPHTRTGNRLEVPVKRLIQGHPLEQVASPDAVDDFATLAQFTGYARGPR